MCINNRTKNYNKQLLADNMMGPNSMLILEELVENLTLKPGMKILDLGCGRGLTSIFLAKEFKVKVFAVDLWIGATENFETFKKMGVDHLVTPLHCDALDLPFADNYFDGVISVDSYHYYGCDDSYYVKKLKPILKKDSLMAIAFPGMKNELKAVPEEMKPFWREEDLALWHSISWWRSKFEDQLNNFKIDEMRCFDQSWSDWLKTENPYAIGDRDMIATDNGRYMNLIKFTGKVIK